MLRWLFDSFSTKAWELYCDSYLLSYLLRLWELCYDELHFPYKWGFVHMQWAEAFLFAEIHLFFSLAAIFGSDFRTVAMCSHCSDLSWQNYGSFHWMNKILCCWRTYDVKLHEYNMECILFSDGLPQFQGEWNMLRKKLLFFLWKIGLPSVISKNTRQTIMVCWEKIYFFLLYILYNSALDLGT